MLLLAFWPELAVGGQGPLLLGFTRHPSTIKEIRYHQEPIARRDQMDIFNVDAQLCWGGEEGAHRGRDSPQGFADVRPITPKAWCLQSVSHCHGELVRSRSCTEVNVSEA